MSFSDTYSEEVLHSRRTRAQRAGFWAKIVSVLLMITIAATLRSEPQLRQVLMVAGMDAVSALSGQERPDASEPRPGTTLPDMKVLEGLMQQMRAQGGALQAATSQGSADPPRQGIKINRPGASGQNRHHFQRVPGAEVPEETSHAAPAADPGAMAAQLGRMLQKIGMGN